MMVDKSCGRPVRGKNHGRTRSLGKDRVGRSRRSFTEVMTDCAASDDADASRIRIRVSRFFLVGFEIKWLPFLYAKKPRQKSHSRYKAEAT